MALMNLRLCNTNDLISVNIESISLVEADFSKDEDFRMYDGAKLARSKIYLTISFMQDRAALRVITVDRFGKENPNISELDLAIQSFTEAANRTRLTIPQ